MTDQTPESPKPSPRWKPLDARQRRVLGVLIEKAKTTPAAYPLTVNAVVTGCNQKNNRDPLTTFDDFGVEKALDELRNMGAVSEIDWLGRVSKYKHHAYEWLGVDKPEIAVMTELLLRGAQALGELRARAARMEPIADLTALRPIVDALLARGLMIEFTPPGRGQIVSHNLYLPEELAELKAHYAGHDPRETHSDHDASESRRPAPLHAPSSGLPPSSPRSIPEGASAGVPADVLASLTREVSELRAEVARLRDSVGELEARLAMALGPPEPPGLA